MKIAVATLRGISPYSQSRYHDTPELEKEGKDAHEMRTWANRLHVTDDGHVFIPPMSFKKALETAASFLRMRIPGKDRSEYGKHFKAGVLVTDGLVLPMRKDDVPGEVFFVSATGKKGGSRVKRKFPVIREWSGEVTFYILDDTITEDVFTKHLREAGNFIGIGRFRPENGGFYGRFTVEAVNWQDASADLAMAA